MYVYMNLYQTGKVMLRFISLELITCETEFTKRDYHLHASLIL